LLLALLAVALPGSAQATDPITYTIDGTPGTNGWYRGSTLGNFVRVRWSINVDVLDASQCGSPMVAATVSTRFESRTGSIPVRPTIRKARKRGPFVSSAETI